MSITQKEFYEKAQMPLGWHFKWLHDECYVDNRGVLLLHDTYDGGWIFSRYETMQAEYVYKHIDDIKPLRLKELCWDVGSDVINPHFPTDEQKKFDEMIARDNNVSSNEEE